MSRVSAAMRIIRGISFFISEKRSDDKEKEAAIRDLLYVLDIF